MHTIILILLLLFCGLELVVWLLNMPAMNPLTQPMSAYLAPIGSPTPQLTLWADLGFGCLALASLLIAHAWGGGILLYVLAIAAAAALVIVVGTKLLLVKRSSAELETIHVRAAGLAFLAVAAMIVLHAHDGWQFWLVVVAAAFDIAYKYFGSPKMLVAVEERVTTACYLVALLTLT